jgi:hypothetical protein
MSGELVSLFDQQHTAPSDPATGQPASIALPVPAGWPAAPAKDAFHGLPGAIVEKIAPNTEGDPVAILTQLLVCCGALIGRGAYFQVEATLHHPNQFLLLIGETSRGRKGSALDHVTRLLGEVDPAFPARLATGLSSGEGVVWKVRDGDGQDAGAADKRLLVIETEFASVLKSASRETSTLSSTLRNVWDGRPLALMTRTAPATATGAHISIIGHITHSELRRHATSTEIANGFLNRFVLAAVRRVRLLPEGGNPDPLKGSGLAGYLATVLGHARTAGQLKLEAAARELWWHAYPQLTQPADGLAGQLTARTEAHTIRLALLYALLDGQRQIKTEHLTAALALWDYAARSAAWALAQATGDPLAEQLHAALLRSPHGLTRTQLSDLLDRHQPANRIQQALDALHAQGRAHHTRILTAGRAAELWTAAPRPIA